MTQTIDRETGTEDYQPDHDVSADDLELERRPEWVQWLKNDIYATWQEVKNGPSEKHRRFLSFRRASHTYELDDEGDARITYTPPRRRHDLRPGKNINASFRLRDPDGSAYGLVVIGNMTTNSRITFVPYGRRKRGEHVEAESARPATIEEIAEAHGVMERGLEEWRARQGSTTVEQST